MNTDYDLVKLGLQQLGVSYQEYVDSVFVEKYNNPTTPGFAWDPELQVDFTYEQMETELGIYTMATYVDLDSPAAYKHGTGFKLSKGSMPRMKHGFAMNEKDLREQAVLLKRFNMFSDSMKRVILRNLFDSTDKLIGGNHHSLAYQRHQIVSNGKFQILDTNNPGGIQNIDFNFAVKDDNKTTVTEKWFTVSNGTWTANTSADPLKDLKDMYVRATNKDFAPVGHIEMDKTLYDEFIYHPEVRKQCALISNPLVGDKTAATLLSIGNLLPDEQVRRMIEAKVGCPIVVVDAWSAIEKWDSTSREVAVTKMRSFNNKVCVFVPDGNLGTIKAVETIVVPDPAQRGAYFDGGRTVLKQRFNGETNTQYIESELSALCVPSTSRWWYYLTVIA